MVSIKFNNHYNNNDKNKQQTKEIEIDNCIITNYDPTKENPSGSGDMTLSVKDGKSEYKRGQSIFNDEDVKLNQKKYSVFTKIASFDENDSNLTQQDLSDARKDYDKNQDVWLKLGVTEFRYDPVAGVATVKFGDTELLRIDFVTEKETTLAEKETPAEQGSTDSINNTELQSDTTYTVQEKETLWRISQKFGVGIEELKLANNLSDEKLSEGQTLIIPMKSDSISVVVKENSTPVKQPEQVEQTIYSVGAKETLWRISQKFGVGIEELKLANNLSDEKLSEGQTLIIPMKSDSTSVMEKENSTPVKQPEQVEQTIYSVGAKETLWRISQKFGVGIEELKLANNLSDEKLSEGQTLIIPMKSDSVVVKENSTPVKQPEQVEQTIYSVGTKETLWNISQKFGVGIEELKSANNLSDEKLSDGQTLIIPNVARQTKTNLTKPLEELVDSKNNRKYVVVKQGDTLYNIAKRLGISEETLIEYNPLINAKAGIHIMDELWTEAPKEEMEPEDELPSIPIEELEAEIETAYQTIISNGTQTPVKGLKNVYKVSGKHTVEKGETLASIAIKYDIPLEILKQDNNIKRFKKVKKGSTLTINYNVYKIQSHGTSEQIAKHIYNEQEQINDLTIEIEALNQKGEEYIYGKGELVRLPNNIIISEKQTKPSKNNHVKKKLNNNSEKNNNYWNIDIQKFEIKTTNGITFSEEYPTPLALPKTFQEYKNALAMRESSNTLDIQNRYGYIGLYQFGEQLLADIGLYEEKKKGHFKNNWQGVFKENEWGITSKTDFLSSREKQDAVLVATIQKNWEYIQAHGLDKFVGKTYKGVYITRSGLIAGAHLIGNGYLNKFFKQGIDEKDGNKVPVSEYLQKFAGYNMDEIIN